MADFCLSVVWEQLFPYPSPVPGGMPDAKCQEQEAYLSMCCPNRGVAHCRDSVRQGCYAEDKQEGKHHTEPLREPPLPLDFHEPVTLAEVQVQMVGYQNEHREAKGAMQIHPGREGLAPQSHTSACLHLYARQECQNACRQQ